MATFPILANSDATGIGSLTVRAVHAPYMLLPDADYYFNERLNNDAWFAESDSKRLRALMTATRYIDRLNYHGCKTVATQFLEFPRNGGTTTPEDVQFACCEIAYNLLDGRDPEFESEHIHLTQSNISSIKINKDVDNIPMHVLYNIPSSLAWAYLRPYLVDTQTLQLQRNS